MSLSKCAQFTKYLFNVAILEIIVQLLSSLSGNIVLGFNRLHRFFFLNNKNNVTEEVHQRITIICYYEFVCRIQKIIKLLLRNF